MLLQFRDMGLLDHRYGLDRLTSYYLRSDMIRLGSEIIPE